MAQPVDSIQASPSDYSAPASNTAAVATAAGANGVAHSISGVAFSYAGSGTLSGGNVIIADGGTTVFSLDVDAKGVYVVTFPEGPMRAAPGNALTATLAAGGSNVTGKINLLGHRRESAADEASQGRMDFRYKQNIAQVVML